MSTPSRTNWMRSAPCRSTTKGSDRDRATWRPAAAGFFGGLTDGRLRLGRVPLVALDIGHRGRRRSPSGRCPPATVRCGAEECVHGALGVGGDQDQGLGRGQAGAVVPAVEVDPGGPDLMAEDLAELVVATLPMKAGLPPKEAMPAMVLATEPPEKPMVMSG